MSRIADREEAIEEEYHVSIYIVVYKFILGVSEFLLGIVIVFFGSEIYRSYEASLLRELSEDPHDLIARLSENFVPGVLTHNTYIILYLVVLGLAKMLGAVGLIYKKNWGVDLLVGLTLLMAPFQIINLVVRPNLPDLLFFAVGLLIALYLVEFRPSAWISRMLTFSRDG